MAMHRKWLVMVFACAWLAAVVLGLRGLWGYANRAGESGAAANDWPATTTLVRGDKGATLVMFVHPMCPCSTASAGELARLLARCEQPIDVKVLAVEPPDAPKTWAQSSLVKTLREIPGVTVMEDQGGAEARRFGARTSGHTMLFDARGRLLFSGGITAARGHAGDSAGSESIVALVNHDGNSQREADVFGCSLFGDTTMAQRTQ